MGNEQGRMSSNTGDEMTVERRKSPSCIRPRRDKYVDNDDIPERTPGHSVVTSDVENVESVTSPSRPAPVAPVVDTTVGGTKSQKSQRFDVLEVSESPAEKNFGVTMSKGSAIGDEQLFQNSNSVRDKMMKDESSPLSMQTGADSPQKKGDASNTSKQSKKSKRSVIEKNDDSPKSFGLQLSNKSVPGKDKLLGTPTTASNEELSDDKSGKKISILSNVPSNGCLSVAPEFDSIHSSTEDLDKSKPTKSNKLRPSVSAGKLTPGSRMNSVKSSPKNKAETEEVEEAEEDAPSPTSALQQSSSAVPSNNDVEDNEDAPPQLASQATAADPISRQQTYQTEMKDYFPGDSQRFNTAVLDAAKGNTLGHIEEGEDGLSPSSNEEADDNVNSSGDIGIHPDEANQGSIAPIGFFGSMTHGITSALDAAVKNVAMSMNNLDGGEEAHRKKGQVPRSKPIEGNGDVDKSSGRRGLQNHRSKKDKKTGKRDNDSAAPTRSHQLSGTRSKTGSRRQSQQQGGPPQQLLDFKDPLEIDDKFTTLRLRDLMAKCQKHRLKVWEYYLGVLGLEKTDETTLQISDFLSLFEEVCQRIWKQLNDCGLEDMVNILSNLQGQVFLLSKSSKHMSITINLLEFEARDREWFQKYGEATTPNTDFNFRVFVAFLETHILRRILYTILASGRGDIDCIWTASIKVTFFDREGNSHEEWLDNTDDGGGSASMQPKALRLQSITE